MLIAFIINRFYLIYIININKSYILKIIVILFIIILKLINIKNIFLIQFLFFINKFKPFKNFLKINLILLNYNIIYSLHINIYYYYYYLNP